MFGPHGDLLMPSSFMSIAEETGLIVPLGAGVLDDACSQLVAWRQDLGDRAPATVSVNVAARQLATASFADLVKHALERHGLAARSAEHTSELHSLLRISYAVFFLKNT